MSREDVERYIEHRKPLLWLGAGASIAARYLTTDGLADELWARRTFAARPPDETDPYKLIDAFVAAHKPGDLVELLAKPIPAGRAPTGLHDALARLTGAGRFSDILTTNYDDLPETALGGQGVEYLREVFEQNSASSAVG